MFISYKEVTLYYEIKKETGLKSKNFKVKVTVKINTKEEWTNTLIYRCSLIHLNNYFILASDIRVSNPKIQEPV